MVVILFSSYPRENIWTLSMKTLGIKTFSNMPIHQIQLCRLYVEWICPAKKTSRTAAFSPLLFILLPCCTAGYTWRKAHHFLKWTIVPNAVSASRSLVTNLKVGQRNFAVLSKGRVCFPNLESWLSLCIDLTNLECGGRDILWVIKSGFKRLCSFSPWPLESLP